MATENPNLANRYADAAAAHADPNGLARKDQPQLAARNRANYKSRLDRANEEVAEIRIRDWAEQLDKQHPKGTYLITARGRRIGPFGGETLVHAIANNPGAREAIPGTEPASLSVGANGEAVPRIRVWEMPHW